MTHSANALLRQRSRAGGEVGLTAEGDAGRVAGEGARISTMLPHASRRQQKAASPLVTGQESLYLRFLSEKQVPVNVKLRDGEVVSGWIEYYDDGMIRLTREGKPNLFIYKHQIRTISELARKEEGRNRAAMRKSALAEAPAPGASGGHSPTPPQAMIESAR